MMLLFYVYVNFLLFVDFWIVAFLFWASLLLSALLSVLFGRSSGQLRSAFQD